MISNIAIQLELINWHAFKWFQVVLCENEFLLNITSLRTQLNGFMSFNLILIIPFNIIHLLTHISNAFKYCYLNKTDLQSLLFSTFKIKQGLLFVCHKSNLKNTIGTIRVWHEQLIDRQPNRLELQNTSTASLQRGKTPIKRVLAQSARIVKYSNWISAEGYPPLPNECPGYDIKQSEGEIPVMLVLRGLVSAPSLPLLPGQFWFGMGAPDRFLLIGQIELFDIETGRKLMTYAKWLFRNRNVW